MLSSQEIAQAPCSRFFWCCWRIISAGKALHTFPDHALARLCLFRRRIGNGKWSGAVKLLELAFGLRQPVGDRPERSRIDADSDMAGEMDLDVLGGIGGLQAAGPPVHDAVRPRVDR